MAKYIKNALGLPQRIEQWNLTASGTVTIAVGDIMAVAASTNGFYCAEATSTSTSILGFAMEAKTITDTTDTVEIDVNPFSIWELETSATATQDTCYDLTDADTVNVGANTYKVVRCIKKDPGASTTAGWFMAAKHFYGVTNLTA